MICYDSIPSVAGTWSTGAGELLLVLALRSLSSGTTQFLKLQRVGCRRRPAGVVGRADAPTCRPSSCWAPCAFLRFCPSARTWGFLWAVLSLLEGPVCGRSLQCGRHTSGQRQAVSLAAAVPTPWIV